MPPSGPAPTSPSFSSDARRAAGMPWNDNQRSFHSVTPALTALAASKPRPAVPVVKRAITTRTCTPMTKGALDMVGIASTLLTHVAARFTQPFNAWLVCFGRDGGLPRRCWIPTESWEGPNVRVHGQCCIRTPPHTENALPPGFNSVR